MPKFERSALYPGEKVYDDSNYTELLDSSMIPAGMSRGMIPRDWDKHPHGGLGRGSGKFPKNRIIPRSEWTQRIAEMEKEKTRLSDLMLEMGLPCKDQNGTNYCWINAPVHCVEIILALQNQRDEAGSLVILSPASCGAKIKNFRNSGGWGQEGLQYLREHGAVPTKLWPANAIQRQYDTEAAWQVAKRYKVTSWWDLTPRSFDEKMTLHFMRIPTADGYNWWRHEVTGYDPVVVSPGKYGARERNSWSMSYGDRGFFVLAESKATPDDCCAPSVILPA